MNAIGMIMRRDRLNLMLASIVVTETARTASAWRTC